MAREDRRSTTTRQEIRKIHQRKMGDLFRKTGSLYGNASNAPPVDVDELHYDERLDMVEPLSVSFEFCD